MRTDREDEQSRDTTTTVWTPRSAFAGVDSSRPRATCRCSRSMFSMLRGYPARPALNLESNQ